MLAVVTGGSGFIGSHVLRLMVLKYPNCHFFNLDVLSYAGNLENIKDIESVANYTFIKGDLCDAVLEDKTLLEYIMDEYVYLISDTKVEELQKIVDENFGED